MRKFAFSAQPATTRVYRQRAYAEFRRQLFLAEIPEYIYSSEIAFLGFSPCFEVNFGVPQGHTPPPKATNKFLVNDFSVACFTSKIVTEPIFDMVRIPLHSLPSGNATLSAAE
jgi:hypothetical protein